MVQIAQGYYHFELGLYFRELFLNRLTQLWILCVLAMFVQTMVNNKYLGHFVMVLYIVATIALPPAGFQDYLYRFGQTPQVTYSDINGYGPFLQPLIWFRLYWAIAAVLLAIVTNLLWVRGTESSWRVRMNLAAARFSRATLAGATVCVVLLLGVGGYIFYNTHILNPYRTTFKIDEDARAIREEVPAILVAAAAAHHRRDHANRHLSRAALGFRQRHHVAGEQDLIRHRSHCRDPLADRTSRRCRGRTSRSRSSASPEARPR